VEHWWCAAGSSLSRRHKLRGQRLGQLLEKGRSDRARGYADSVLLGGLIAGTVRRTRQL